MRNGPGTSSSLFCIAATIWVIPASDWP